MTRLHVEHPIAAYPTWREAFDRFADARVGAGGLSTRLARPINDDHYMVIDLGFATPAAAQSFLAFLVQHVWATPASSPGLAGTPRTMILDELDCASSVNGIRASDERSCQESVGALVPCEVAAIDADVVFHTHHQTPTRGTAWSHSQDVDCEGFRSDGAAWAIVGKCARDIRENMTGRINGWKQILNTLVVHYGDRINPAKNLYSKHT